MRLPPLVCETRLRAIALGLAWTFVACLSVHCGSDPTSAPDAGMPGKQQCISPGIGGACTCQSGTQGTMTCGTDGYWSACVCVESPPGARCHENELLRCGTVCPGESAARVVRCVGGDYDCSCHGTQDDAGAGQDAG